MINNQVYVFFWSILIGAVLTLIFDFFRLMRRNKETRDLVVYIQDIFFWLIVAVVIIISAFIINSGELRGYMFIGYALGSMFYLLLLSKLILKVFGTIFDKIDLFFEKIFTLFRKILKKFNFKKKNTNIQQEN